MDAVFDLPHSSIFDIRDIYTTDIGTQFMMISQFFNTYLSKNSCIIYYPIMRYNNTVFNNHNFGGTSNISITSLDIYILFVVATLTSSYLF